MSNLKPFLLIILSLILSFCSMQEEQIERLNIPEQKLTKEVEEPEIHENGYLIFKDLHHFVDFRNKIATFSEDEYKAWEASLNFSSAHAFYHKVMYEEENKPDDAEHSELFIQNKELFIEDETFGFILDIPTWNMQKVLTQNGLVQLDNQVWKYEYDRVIVFNPNETNKEKFIKNDHSVINYVGEILREEKISSLKIQNNSRVESFTSSFTNTDSMVFPAGVLDATSRRYGLLLREQYLRIVVHSGHVTFDYEVMVGCGSLPPGSIKLYRPQSFRLEGAFYAGVSEFGSYDNTSYSTIGELATWSWILNISLHIDPPISR